MLISKAVFESLFLALFTVPVFSQSGATGLRPDVTFGDHNDRFDIASLVNYQNKYFRAQDGSDFRRKHVPKKKLRTNKNKDKKKVKILRTEGSEDRKWILSSYKSRQKLEERIKKDADEEINNLANMMLLRLNSMRRNGEDDFAFHDDMESGGGNEFDFNENLARFQANRTEKRQQNMGYRRIDPNVDLFNYAFPIDMTINGYLVAPEE